MRMPTCTFKMLEDFALLMLVIFSPVFNCDSIVDWHTYFLPRSTIMLSVSLLQLFVYSSTIYVLIFICLFISPPLRRQIERNSL